MSGIFPSIADGGIVVRDIAGNPTGALGVVNAYLPPATFTMSCTEALYGSDCTVLKWRPDTYNALAGEMLALAVAMNPTGTWACGVIGNLGSNFTAWASGTGSGSLRAAIAASPEKFMALPAAP